MEDKSQKFKRIAGSRTQRILDDLRLLRNCANRNTYAYADEDITKIFSAIEADLKRTRMSFKESKRKQFSL
ncbi:MAG TPA: hypothetical protein VMR98_02765 [Candidatus Polarisedimenticolaceae bacterium]|nr:hypothetical protein [Candidatus Polarisedimenticolaceae bacterium]